MFVDVIGFEGYYAISPEGIVMNVRTGRVLSPYKHNKGYLNIDLYKDGVRYNVQLHRLVAINFIPNPNNYPMVLHIDNNKHNCNATNLKWGTASDNAKQAYRDGLISKESFNGFDYIITSRETGIINPIAFHGMNTIHAHVGGNKRRLYCFCNDSKPLSSGPYKGYYIDKVEIDERSTIIP